MLISLHCYFEHNKIPCSIIDLVLPKLIKEFQGEFCRFADCGAGVGHTALFYEKLLKNNLSDEIINKAIIECYEPLVENFKQLVILTGCRSIFKLHQTAVSNFVGSSNFIIPSRCKVDYFDWVVGTSFNGFLHDRSFNETILVNVIKLENENSFDFLKLDLQGGEYKAINGLGTKLNDVKLLYVEHQLLHNDLSINYLNNAGFVMFFDKLQFSFNNTVDKIPVGALNDLGVIVEQNHHMKSPSYCIGYFNSYHSLIDSDTMMLNQNTINGLREIGVNYMQTDVLAFNRRLIDVDMFMNDCLKQL